MSQPNIIDMQKEIDQLNQQVESLRRLQQTAEAVSKDLMCCGNCVSNYRNQCKFKQQPECSSTYCKNWKFDGLRSYQRLIAV